MVSFLSFKTKKTDDTETDNNTLSLKEQVLNLQPKVKLPDNEDLIKRVEILEDLIYGNKGASSILKRLDELEELVKNQSLNCNANDSYSEKNQDESEDKNDETPLN